MGGSTYDLRYMVRMASVEKDVEGFVGPRRLNRPRIPCLEWHFSKKLALNTKTQRVCILGTWTRTLSRSLQGTCLGQSRGNQTHRWNSTPSYVDKMYSVTWEASVPTQQRGGLHHLVASVSAIRSGLVTDIQT